MATACTGCGAEQRIGELAAGSAAYCRRCDTPLERTAGRSLDAGLACAIATLALLIPAIVLPVLRSHLAGQSLDGHLIEGATVFWRDGWPLVALMVGAFVVVFPVVRSAIVTAVLASLRLGHRGAWQGRLFRYAEALRLWSMPEVMLLAMGVTYTRVAAQLTIEVPVGGWCFVAAALLAMMTDGAMDRRQVWRAIRPDEPLTGREQAVGCDVCALALGIEHEGEPCPRCAKTLHVRKPGSLNRCAALTLAGYVLFVPAFSLPMTQSVTPLGRTERSVLDGIEALFGAGFWYLGVLIFVMSVAIPLVKLVALTWLMWRVKRPAVKGLVRRTKVHWVIHEINHWSYIDPYIVAMTAPMMAYAGLADVHAGPGALAFSLVVALTMLASEVFDPRLMWDAAEGRL